MLILPPRPHDQWVTISVCLPARGDSLFCTSMGVRAPPISGYLFSGTCVIWCSGMKRTCLVVNQGSDGLFAWGRPGVASNCVSPSFSFLPSFPVRGSLILLILARQKVETFEGHKYIQKVPYRIISRTWTWKFFHTPEKKNFNIDMKKSKNVRSLQEAFA